MFEKWKLHPKSMIVSHFVAEGYKRKFFIKSLMRSKALMGKIRLME